MVLYDIRRSDNSVFVQVKANNEPCSQKMRKSLIRYAARCARKANLLIGCYNVECGKMDVIMYSKKDRNRLKHLLAMLNGKKADKVFFSSLGR